MKPKDSEYVIELINFLERGYKFSDDKKRKRIRRKQRLILHWWADAKIDEWVRKTI